MPKYLFPTLLITFTVLTSYTASAHIRYTGRNFGSFSGLTTESVSINNQTVRGNFGWVDGTDEDLGDSHNTRYFRFTLDVAALVTITVNALPDSNGTTALFWPGFSVYSGLARLAGNADHDGSDLTLAYLESLPGPPKEGAFDALSTWKVGPDAEEGQTLTFADLTTFTFQGYAVDGTSAEYGPGPITGDGLTDGAVTKTFQLGQGDYSLFVGGANFAASSVTPPDAVSYPIGVTVTAEPVPEPSTALLVLGGALLMTASRRQRA
jgi:hypothetical protein